MFVYKIHLFDWSIEKIKTNIHMVGPPHLENEQNKTVL